MPRDFETRPPEFEKRVERARSGDRTALLGLLAARGEEREYLFAMARAVRDSVFGPTAILRGVIEVTNACRKSCHYCPMRIENRERRYVLRADELREAAMAVRKAGLGVVFLQGGEVPGAARLIGELLPDIRGIFDDSVEVLLGLGTLPSEDLAMLRRRGADGYIIKHETSDPILHQAMRQSPLAERLDCVRNLLGLGYRVGVGAIVGLPGQSPESLVDDILLPGRMGAHMASASPFVPAADTPLAAEPPGDAEATLNVMALTRLLNPSALIPSVSALERTGPGGQGRGLLAGANVVTVNFTPPANRDRFAIYGADRFVVRMEHALATLAAAGLKPRWGADAFSFWGNG
jgi:biotin synthase